MNILIDGPQGSGKSTQANLLAQKLKLPLVSSGEILRNITLLDDSPTAEKIRETLSLGKLLDDHFTAELINKRLSRLDCQNGFILDGFPRNKEQLGMLKVKLDRVIYLKISDDEAVRRLLLRKRADDNKDTIKQRLNTYHAQTEPMLDKFRKNSILIEIDGEKSIEEIHQEILRRFQNDN